MTNFPAGLRPAVEGDEKRVFDLCCMAHAENGFGKLDEPTVREFIRKATHAEGNIIGIVDGPDCIEAMMGLSLMKLWYTVDEPDSYYWFNAFTFVHPLHRRSKHAAKLFRFAQWWEEKIGQPVVLELMPKDDLEEKEKFFSRYGRRIGATYLVGNGAPMMCARPSV